MVCKSCGKEVERVSDAGFCSNGICSIMEQGYLLGLQDVTAHLAEQARLAQRVGPISVDENGGPRREKQRRSVVNSKTAMQDNALQTESHGQAPRPWP